MSKNTTRNEMAQLLLSAIALPPVLIVYASVLDSPTELANSFILFSLSLMAGLFLRYWRITANRCP